MHCLGQIYLCGIIVGSGMRKGRGRCSRSSGGMQDEFVSFGLQGKLVDVLPGYGVASKVSDEAGKT